MAPVRPFNNCTGDGGELVIEAARPFLAATYARVNQAGRSEWTYVYIT